MKVTLIVEAQSRADEWACLERKIYWTAQLTRAQLWTIVAELRAVLMRVDEGRFFEPEQAKGEAVAPPAATEGENGHL